LKDNIMKSGINLAMFRSSCPPAPTAENAAKNPSWSPALEAQNNPIELPPILHLQNGRIIIENDDQFSKGFREMFPNHWLIRVPSTVWWIRVEDKVQNEAKDGDRFMCRRDYITLAKLVENPTDDEISTLMLKQTSLTDHTKKGYFKEIRVVNEYGSTYEGNGRWRRHKVAYLKGEESPYPFENDCREEMHKIFDE
jgi:hypothetical protein